MWYAMQIDINSLATMFLRVGIDIIMGLAIQNRQLFKCNHTGAYVIIQYQMEIVQLFNILLSDNQSGQVHKAKTAVGQAYYNALVLELKHAHVAEVNDKDDYNLLNGLINEIGNTFSSQQIYQSIANMYTTLNCDSIRILKICIKELLEKDHFHCIDPAHELTAFQHDSSHYIEDKSQSAQSQQKNHEKQNKQESKNKDYSISNHLNNQQKGQNLPFVLDISEIHSHHQQPIVQSNNYQYRQTNWVEQYLSSVPNFRSQINLLCQQMKIPPVLYERYKDHKKYFVRASIRFNYSMNYFEYTGTGCSTIYKHACEQAAHATLRQIYTQLPQILYSFVQIKTIKGL